MVLVRGGATMGMDAANGITAETMAAGVIGEDSATGTAGEIDASSLDREDGRGGSALLVTCSDGSSIPNMTGVERGGR